jgi:hypothetical protein
MTLTDADILTRLTNIEDATVERKTMSDFRDSVDYRRGDSSYENFQKDKPENN